MGGLPDGEIEIKDMALDHVWSVFLLSEQSFFRGFTIVFDLYHEIIRSVCYRPEKTEKLMLSTILVKCSTYF
jgi:hypothetical protein